VIIGEFVGVSSGIMSRGVVKRECDRIFGKEDEKFTTVEGGRELGFMARCCKASLEERRKRTGATPVTSVRRVKR
jgi:hypothetical protein